MPPQIISVEKQPSGEVLFTPMKGIITDRFQTTAETELCQWGLPVNCISYDEDNHPHIRSAPLTAVLIRMSATLNNCWWNDIILHEKRILYNG